MTKRPIAMALTKESKRVAVLWISSDGTRSLTVTEDGQTALTATLDLRIVDPVPRVNETEREDQERREAVSRLSKK